MTGGPILWLALLVALAGLFILTVRRMSVLIARTRDLERFQRSSDSINRRLAAAVDPLVARLDEIRRRSGDPGALAKDLTPSLSMLGDLARETRELRPPRLLGDLAAAMAHETERAVRAGDLVRHGVDALEGAHAIGEIEALTSLKRGALNLRSARIEFARLTAEGAALRPVDLLGRGGGAPDSGRLAARLAYPGTEDDDADAGFDPRI